MKFMLFSSAREIDMNVVAVGIEKMELHQVHPPKIDAFILLTVSITLSSKSEIPDAENAKCSSFRSTSDPTTGASACPTRGLMPDRAGSYVKTV